MRQAVHATTISAIESGVPLCLTLGILCGRLLWDGKSQLSLKEEPRPEPWQQSLTHRVSPQADCTWDSFLGRVFPGPSYAGDEWLVSRDDVNEKVELVGLAKRLGDVRAGQGAPFIGIGDYERPCSDLCDENFRVTARKKYQRTRNWGEGREEMGEVSVLSHALQNRMGAGRDTVKDMKGKLRDRQTIGGDHLRKIEGVMGRYKREKQKGAPLRPGRSS